MGHKITRKRLAEIIREIIGETTKSQRSKRKNPFAKPYTYRRDPESRKQRNDQDNKKQGYNRNATVSQTRMSGTNPFKFPLPSDVEPSSFEFRRQTRGTVNPTPPVKPHRGERGKKLSKLSAAYGTVAGRTGDQMRPPEYIPRVQAAMDRKFDAQKKARDVSVSGGGVVPQDVQQTVTAGGGQVRFGRYFGPPGSDPQANNPEKRKYLGKTSGGKWISADQDNSQSKLESTYMKKGTLKEVIREIKKAHMEGRTLAKKEGSKLARLEAVVKKKLAPSIPDEPQPE